MQLFGIELWEKSKKDFLEKILKQVQDDVTSKKPIWIATVNPEFMVESWRDKRFLNILQNKTSYNVIDGHGIIWASQISKQVDKLTSRSGGVIFKLKLFVEVFFGGKYREKLITGVDLMQELCAMAEIEKIPVYFLGGWEPEKVAEYFQKKYKKLEVAGYSKEATGKLVDPPTGEAGKLTSKLILFVALGMKKQEFWIEDNWEKLPAGVVMGVGRSFDYYAGSIKRAPVWMRKMGLEWLFSLVMDPRHRLARQLKNLPVFVWKVLKNNNL